MNENKKREMIEDLQELVMIRTVTGGTLGRIQCQDSIKRFAKRFGFVSSLHANNQVLVISPKGFEGQPKLGIIVHSDTVPINESEWRHDPYGEVCNGRIYGCGVIDDKMGIITSLYAMSQVKDRIENSWQIVVGSREEGQWLDMEDYLNENPILPKFSITIDGDGVQHGCRGNVNIRFKFPVKKGIRSGISSITCRNRAWNVTPHKIIVKLNDGRVTEVTSEAMHSAFATNRKENAIYKMAEANKEPFNEEFPGFMKLIERYVNTDNAEAIGLKTIPEELKQKGFPDSSICPTLCQLKDGILRIGVNLRVSVGIFKEDVLEALENLKNELGCEYDFQESVYSSYVMPDSEEIKLLLESYKKILGKETKSTFALGTGYNAVFPNCAIFGPRFDPEHDEEDLCHKAEESRKLEDIYTFEAMLEDFVQEYLKK